MAFAYPSWAYPTNFIAPSRNRQVQRRGEASGEGPACSLHSAACPNPPLAASLLLAPVLQADKRAVERSQAGQVQVRCCPALLQPCR